MMKLMVVVVVVVRVTYQRSVDTKRGRNCRCGVRVAKVMDVHQSSPTVYTWCCRAAVADWMYYRAVNVIGKALVKCHAGHHALVLRPLQRRGYGHSARDICLFTSQKKSPILSFSSFDRSSDLVHVAHPVSGPRADRRSLPSAFLLACPPPNSHSIHIPS
ncbi:hypothetical protein MRB53_039675 [Persea americana]|nr:hypothetical protein MRB53_039675 [Persea americana]